jgi:glutamine amidotransferase
MSKVTIVDYELGNLGNVRRAFESVGAETVFTQDPAQIAKAERLVLPGVAAFGAGMANLNRLGLVEPIREFAKTGRPLIGLCLGMQLLLTSSEERGSHKGLDLVPGKVLAFPKGAQASDGRKFKVPQIGWNSLKGSSWEKTIFKDLPKDPQVYFVHSYYVSPQDPKVTLASTDYAGMQFCSALSHQNLAACQFHPERSGPVGLKILKNFLDWRP